VLDDHQDWLVVTLEPWLEEELLFELLELELLEVEPLEVEPESLEVVLLESSGVVVLDVPESLDVVVLADEVVAVSSEVAFACCDASLDVVEPR
jgi:hypothetical protein